MKIRYILIIATLFVGCSSSSKTPSLDHLIEQIAFQSLKFRRPEGQIIDPKVGPGGVDYRRTVNGNFECQSPYDFYKNTPFKEAVECLKSAEQLEVLKFNVIRDGEPYLKLEHDSEEEKNCLNQYFEKIYLPREIVFLAKSPDLEVDRYSCFSSRLDIEKDRFMGARVPIHSKQVIVTLPLRKYPESQDEFNRLLTGWALGPFFVNEGKSINKHILSRIVSNSICSKCLTVKAEPKLGDPEPDLWPEKQDGKK